MVGCGDDLCVALRLVIAGREADFDPLKLAENAASNQLNRSSEFLTGPLLAARLKDGLLFCNFPIDELALMKSVSDWFFAVNIFAVSQSFQSTECVPVVGRCDDDGVDVVPLADFPEVIRDRNAAGVSRFVVGVDAPLCRLATVRLPFAPRPVSMMERIDVANRNDLSVGLFEEFINQIETARARTDDADRDAIARRLPGRAPEGCARNEKRRAEDSETRSASQFACSVSS